MLRPSGFFTLAMGIVMLIVWTVLLATGQVRELTETPFLGVLLLAAEFLTAFALISGGLGVLMRRAWGKALNLSAMGMMLYTSIYSIGVFGQERILPAAIFFAILTVATLFFLAGLIRLEPGVGGRRPA
jgi:hypothetical protein